MGALHDSWQAVIRACKLLGQRIYHQESRTRYFHSLYQPLHAPLPEVHKLIFQLFSHPAMHRTGMAAIQLHNITFIDWNTNLMEYSRPGNFMQIPFRTEQCRLLYTKFCHFNGAFEVLVETGWIARSREPTNQRQRVQLCQSRYFSIFKM